MTALDAAPVPYPTAMERFPHVRQSILSSYDNCRLTTAMDLLYEQGWSTHEQASGTMVHRVFAKALTLMYEQKETAIPGDVMVALLRECLRQHDVDPRDVVTVPIGMVRDLVWIVQKWAKDYAEKIDIAALVDVEQRLKATLRYPHPAGGWVERVFSGQLDALFITGEDADQATVLDWKSGWGLPGPTDLSFDGYFQQRAYALLVMKNYPTVQQVTLREVYVRFSEPREATVYRSDLPEIEAELSALAEGFDRSVEHGEVPWSAKAKSMRRRMRDARRDGNRQRYDALRREYERTVGLWKPAPGSHCSYCVRPQACPILPSARGAGRIADRESAERVGGETVVADAAAARGKGALKAYVDVHGPVHVKDAKGVRVWAFQPQNRTQRPDEEAIAKEVENARLERRSPNIAGLYKTYTGTAFKLVKPGPQTDDADETLIEQLEASIREAERRREAKEAK